LAADVAPLTYVRSVCAQGMRVTMAGGRWNCHVELLRAWWTLGWGLADLAVRLGALGGARGLRLSGGQGQRVATAH